jgi:hypothetical protein
MASSTRFARLPVLCLILACALSAGASPLSSCFKAVISSNGNFLAIVDLQLGPGPSNSRRIERVSLQVFPKEEFVNARDKLSTREIHWTDWPQWSVVLDAPQTGIGPACPLPLITDNGEFVVLLQIGPAFDGHAVLQIYRRRDHIGDPVRPGPDHGVFIKAISLSEIWPGDKHEPSFVTDGTPAWYAGGTFDFSHDSRKLLHKTRWGNTVRINLTNGDVLRGEKP